VPAARSDEQAGLGPESIAALQIVVDAAEHLAAAENVERPLLSNSTG
jgi:hypothetical protein